MKETLHRCQNSLGLFYQKLEHYERALKFINDSLRTVKSMKNKVYECEYLTSKGHVLLLMENPNEARHVFKKACYCKTPVQEDIQKAHFKFKLTSQICKLLLQLSPENNTEKEEREEKERIDRESGLEEKSIETRLEIYEKLGDLFADLEVYQVAVKYYQKELDLAVDQKCNSSIIAPIYVSLAQTYLDQKKYQDALDYFKKELELRAGNLIEATRTSLKIIETKIGMKASLSEMIDLYEEALDRVKDDDACRVRILKDYSVYLHQEKEADKARKVDGLLASLSSQNEDSMFDDPSQLEVNIDDGNPNPEINDFDDLSSLSSSSSDEEKGKESNAISAVSGERSKRRQVKRFKTNELGETPLHRACIEGNAKEVVRLLSKGHPVNQRDHCGWLPIHEACNFGYADIARLLIDAGADINDPGGIDCGGTTPLHDSCSNCVPDVIRLLLEKGADVTKMDNDGNTPIDCLRGWRKRVKELSEEEEDIYKELIQKLEDEMKKKGFDVEAEKRRPVIRVTPFSSSLPSSSLPDVVSERRGGDRIFASHSSRRRMVHSPTSSPPKKKQSTASRERVVLDGNDLDRNYEDPEVARLEYQSVISNLRRQRSKFSPDNSADDDDHDDATGPGNHEKNKFDGGKGEGNGGHLHSTKPSSSRPPLVNEDERIDDWLEDDMGTTSTNLHHRSRIITDLYHSKNLPKNERKINVGKKKNVKMMRKEAGGGSLLSRRNVTFLREGEEEEDDLLQVSNDDTFRKRRRNDGESDDDASSVECVSSSSSTAPLFGEAGGGRERRGDGGRERRGDGGRRGEKVIEDRKSEAQESSESKTKALIKVCLESKSFLMSLPDGNCETISWLIQETVSRYYNLEKKKPVIYLTTKDGSLLSPQDLIRDVVKDGEVKAHIRSFDHLSSGAGYQELCRMNQVKPIHEMDQVLKISETNGNLNLSNMNIPRFHLKILADSIKSNQEKITCLDFSFARFLTNSSSSFSPRLTSSSPFPPISTSSSMIVRPGNTAAVIPSILDLVCKLPRLKELRLQGLGISGRDLDIFSSSAIVEEGERTRPAIAEGERTRPAIAEEGEETQTRTKQLQITLLDLSYNSLGNSSLESLISLLNSLPSLHTLYLIGCNLDSNFFSDPRMVQVLASGTKHQPGSNGDNDTFVGSKIHQVTVDDFIDIDVVTKQVQELNQQKNQNCLKTHKWKKIHRI